MFWVVQDNLYREYNHGILMETLKRMNIPHVEVKVAPFCNMLLPSGFNFNSHTGSIENAKEASIDDSGLVMTCGSITLANIGKKRGWIPGSFLNDNFHYSKWASMYGNNLLNFEAVVGKFKEIEPTWNNFFIRPCEDTKDFNGSIFTKDEFLNWRKGYFKTENSCPFADSEVVASPLKNIFAEYRFFVVDGKVITYSMYKLGSVVVLNSSVDESIIKYAQDMVDIWQPARAFVIDIAETDEGFKIIEINNFNSAGFYACNVGKIIEAIEDMQF